jgi:hypothetical protein
MTTNGSPSPGKHHVTRIPLLGVNKEEESFLSPYDRRSEVYRHLAYEHVKEHPPQTPNKQPLWTVPNALTFLRLVLVPVLMVVWYTGSPSAPLLAAVLFVIASLTDWLDGWIARQVCKGSDARHHSLCVRASVYVWTGCGSGTVF